MMRRGTIYGNRFILFGLSVIVAVLFIFAPKVGAIAVEKGLTVSPIKTEIDIAPGGSFSGKLLIENSTRKLMKVVFNAEAFNTVNQQYDYSFDQGSNIAKWIKFYPSELSLFEGESGEISYSLDIPLSAEPGGKYISLFANNDELSIDVSVSSRQRVASLLYVTILGDITRTGKLVSLSSPWLINNKNEFNAKLQNTGTAHFRSVYSLQVMGLVGDSVIAETKAESLILPGTIRSITNEFPLPKFPGVYKAVYTIGLGDNPAAKETRYFLYIPLIVVIFIVIVLFLGLSLLIRKLIKKN